MMFCSSCKEKMGTKIGTNAQLHSMRITCSAVQRSGDGRGVHVVGAARCERNILAAALKGETIFPLFGTSLDFVTKLNWL